VHVVTDHREPMTIEELAARTGMTVRNIRAHLTSLRKKLAARGQHILCEQYGGAVRYRLVCAVARKTTRLNPV